MDIPVYLCNEVIRELDFRSQCGFARAVGYDGLEVAPFTLAADPSQLDASCVGEFRRIAEGEGVRISGLHWLLAAPEGLSITSADPDTHRRTVEFGRRLVDLCAELGGRYLVHGSPGQRRLDPGREEEGRAQATAYFAAMAEAAGKAGLLYIVEPPARQDTALINSVEEALRVIETIGSPALGTMVDCYAAASNEEDIEELLRRWLPRGAVQHIHFNDANRRGPGEGNLAFGSVLKVLEELGYRGAIGVEPFVYEPDGPACAARAIGYVRGLMENAHTARPQG